jgi:hypothetical protein
MGPTSLIITLHQGSISSSFLCTAFSKLYLRTANCDLQMATSTAKYDLRMAQQVQQKAW